MMKGVTSMERKSAALPFTGPLKVMCPTIWGPGAVPFHCRAGDDTSLSASDLKPHLKGRHLTSRKIGLTQFNWLIVNGSCHSRHK